MMKYVLAVALLHLCCSVKTNMSLNSEISKRLGMLNDLCTSGKLNFTSEYMINAPSKHMKNNASSCVGVFVRELKNLLNNVTVHEDSQHILQELDANLKSLGTHQMNDQICQMEESHNTKPFTQYIHFLRKLNTSKKR